MVDDILTKVDRMSAAPLRRERPITSFEFAATVPMS